MCMCMCTSLIGEGRLVIIIHSMPSIGKIMISEKVNKCRRLWGKNTQNQLIIILEDNTQWNQELISGTYNDRVGGLCYYPPKDMAFQQILIGLKKLKREKMKTWLRTILMQSHHNSPNNCSVLILYQKTALGTDTAEGSLGWDNSVFSIILPVHSYLPEKITCTKSHELWHSTLTMYIMVGMWVWVIL